MRTLFSNDLPGTTSSDGTAEMIPLGDGQVDTIVAAQAFHWFTPGPALDEIHRVLRPGGYLVTVWNVRGDAPWMAGYNLIQEAYSGETPRHNTLLWRNAIEADQRYELVDDWGIDNPQPTTLEGVIDRALSTSFIAALTDDEKAHVVRKLTDLLVPYGSNLVFPYRSELQAWKRL